MNTIIHNNKKYNYINYYSNNKDSYGKQFPKVIRCFKFMWRAE